MPTYLLVLIVILSSVIFLVVAFFAITFLLFKITIGRNSFVGKIVNKQFKRDVQGYKIDHSWWQTQSVEKLFLKTEDAILSGFFIKSNTNSNKLAIVIHGYFSSHLDLVPQAKIFADSGFNVFCPDLRGHGESEGKTIGMAYLDQFDLQKWIKLLIEKLGKNVEIIITGWSMGGATVCMLSGNKLPENVKGFISDASYTSAYDEFKFLLKQRHILSEPIMWLANMGAKIYGKYDFKDASPLLSVEKSTLPILFICGAKDTFVPADMTINLFHAKQVGYKQLEIFENAEHIKSYATDTNRYIKLFQDFVERIFN